MRHRWVAKDFIDKKGLSKQGPIFSTSSLRRFSSILVIWCIVCVLVALFVDTFKWSTYGCIICNKVAAYLPFINYAAQGTLFPELTRSLWLSFCVTLPFVLIFLFVMVKTSKNNKFDMTIPVTLLFVSIGYLVFLMVEGNQGPDLSGLYGRMYSTSKLGNILISSALFISLVSGLFLLIDKFGSMFRSSDLNE